METKANYTLVGIFTVVALFFAFVLVYYTARLGDRSNLQPLDLRIPGSVTGLSEGSQVLFNGIRVGQVRRLMLDPSDPNMVIAKTAINGATPVTRSTQATLGFQGLTGIAFVQLSGGSLEEPNLLREADKAGAVARIDADPSTLNNLLATAQDIFARADSILGDLEGFTHDARGPLLQTVKNADVFTSVLKDKKDDIASILDNGKEMMVRLNQSSQHIDGLMAKLDTLLSPDDKNSLAAQLHQTLDGIQQAVKTLNAHIGPIAANLQNFSGQGLRQIQALAIDSRQSIQRIERSLSDLEQNPQRIIFGGQGSVPQYNGRSGR